MKIGYNLSSEFSQDYLPKWGCLNASFWMDLSLVIVEIPWFSPASNKSHCEEIHSLGNAPKSRFYQNKSIYQNNDQTLKTFF